MKRITISLAALFLSTALLGTVTSSTFAQTTAKKTTTKTTAKAKTTNNTAEVKYKAHCGMIYSAADAKKHRYVCPMDHKPLVKITGAQKTDRKDRKGM
jgi:hypothetical protein